MADSFMFGDIQAESAEPWGLYAPGGKRGGGSPQVAFGGNATRISAKTNDRFLKEFKAVLLHYQREHRTGHTRAS